MNDALLRTIGSVVKCLCFESQKWKFAGPPGHGRVRPGLAWKGKSEIGAAVGGAGRRREEDGGRGRRSEEEGGEGRKRKEKGREEKGERGRREE